MNNLSWLIYAADVSVGLSVILGISGFFATFSGAITLIWATFSGEPYIYRGEQREKRIAQHEATKATVKRRSPRLIAAGLSAWILVAVIPSKETVYAIAASEMGEEVLKSQTAGKAMQALNAWLDRQIAPQPQN